MNGNGRTKRVGRKKKSGGLSPQQEKFCQEYIKDSNGTQAAIRAGYSPNGASNRGAMLMRSPVIREYIQKIQAKAAQKADVTAEKILRELWGIASRQGDRPGSSAERHKIESLKICAGILGLNRENVRVTTEDRGVKVSEMGWSLSKQRSILADIRRVKESRQILSDGDDEMS